MLYWADPHASIENTPIVRREAPSTTRHDEDAVDDDADHGRAEPFDFGICTLIGHFTVGCRLVRRNHSIDLGICVPCIVLLLCVFDKWPNKSPSSVFQYGVWDLRLCSVNKYSGKPVIAMRKTTANPSAFLKLLELSVRLVWANGKHSATHKTPTELENRSKSHRAARNTDKATTLYRYLLGG